MPFVLDEGIQTQVFTLLPTHVCIRRSRFERRISEQVRRARTVKI